MSRENVEELVNHLADMECSLELDRRLHESYLTEEQRARREDIETIGGMSMLEWVDRCFPFLDSGVAASGCSGLVPVPTTQKRARGTVTVPFRVKADCTAIRAAVDAFRCGKSEQQQRRMSKLRMNVGAAARMQRAELGRARTEVLMITTTYADPQAWAPGHIRTLTDHIRKWCARQAEPIKFRYVWVAEIQDGKRRSDGEGRGAMHYHLALWVPSGTRLPMPDQQGWWPHGSTRIEVARGAVQYLMHYLKKGDAKNYERVPRGARVYGIGGLGHVMRRARRWLGLPSFVQGNSDCLDNWRRAVGGGWISPSGEIYCSEFERVKVGTEWCLRRVITHSRAIDASGPFSWLRSANSHSPTPMRECDQSIGV